MFFDAISSVLKTLDRQNLNQYPDDIDGLEERWSSRKKKKERKMKYFSNKDDFGQFVKDYDNKICLIRNDSKFQSAFSKGLLIQTISN